MRSDRKDPAAEIGEASLGAANRTRASQERLERNRADLAELGEQQERPQMPVAEGERAPSMPLSGLKEEIEQVQLQWNRQGAATTSTGPPAGVRHPAEPHKGSSRPRSGPQNAETRKETCCVRKVTQDDIAEVIRQVEPASRWPAWCRAKWRSCCISKRSLPQPGDRPASRRSRPGGRCDSAPPRGLSDPKSADRFVPCFLDPRRWARRNSAKPWPPNVRQRRRHGGRIDDT